MVSPTQANSDTYKGQTASLRKNRKKNNNMERIGDDVNATLEELLDDLEDMNKQVCEDSETCEENSDLSVNKGDDPKDSDMKDRIMTLEMKIKKLSKIILEKDEIIKKSKKEIAILR